MVGKNSPHKSREPVSSQESPEQVDPLTPDIYNELRRLAHTYISKERVDHTLQTTALVNEAYLRAIPQNELSGINRQQLMAMIVNAMRLVLVDHARRHKALKRKGTWTRVPLENISLVLDDFSVDLLTLDEALTRLNIIDPKLTRLIELRFFGGLTKEQIAEVMEISSSTVQREWHFAKTWLRRELSQEKNHEN